MREYSLNDLRVALDFLDCNDRQTWVRAALALKCSYGEDAFAIWDDWSAGYGKYDPKVARNVWKSARAGKLTVGSIFKEAKDKGWIPDAAIQETEQIKRERAERAARRAAQLAQEEIDLARYHELIAGHSAEIFDRLYKVGTSKYLGDKGVQGYGVRFAHEPMLSVIRKDEISAQLITDYAQIRKFLDEANAIPRELRPYSFRHFKRGAFAVPMRDIDGKLWALQMIWPTGKKSYFYNGRKSGCMHIIGEITPDVPCGIGEGYATMASVHAATQWATVCAFDAGNLLSVAQGFRGRYADQSIMICADNDVETEGNPGVAAATAAAQAIGARICIPDFSAVQARAA